MSSIIIGATMLMTMAVVASGYVFDVFSSTVEELKDVSDTSMLLEQIQEFRDQNSNLKSYEFDKDDIVENTQSLVELITAEM